MILFNGRQKKEVGWVGCVGGLQQKYIDRMSEPWKNARGSVGSRFDEAQRVYEACSRIRRGGKQAEAPREFYRQCTWKYRQAHSNWSGIFSYYLE